MQPGLLAASWALMRVMAAPGARPEATAYRHRVTAMDMNSAAGTPLPDTSPMTTTCLPSGATKKSYRSPPTSLAGSSRAEAA